MADWTNEIVIKFLELYQSKDILWNPKHRNHKNKAKINDSYLIFFEWLKCRKL